VWIEDRGPVVFAHYRIDRNGRPFRCYKFRTMVGDAEDVLRELPASDDDLRTEWERDQKLGERKFKRPFSRPTPPATTLAGLMRPLESAATVGCDGVEGRR
jgi:hypothetical protein